MCLRSQSVWQNCLESTESAKTDEELQHGSPVAPAKSEKPALPPSPATVQRHVRWGRASSSYTSHDQAWVPKGVGESCLGRYYYCCTWCLPCCLAVLGWSRWRWWFANCQGRPTYLWSSTLWFRELPARQELVPLVCSIVIVVQGKVQVLRCWKCRRARVGRICLFALLPRCRWECRGQAYKCWVCAH